MSNTGDNYGQYTVGWICAITTEYVAALQFLDKQHGQPEYLPPNDENDYTLGEIGKHHVVVAVLPEGCYGIASAAKVARDMMHSFPNLRIGLMVGIGGGVPNKKHDIRLGDIVVSTPRDGHGGVFQYAFGKSIQDQQFQPTGFLNEPPGTLLAAVGGLKAQYKSDGHGLDEAIKAILDKKPRLRKEFSRPHPSNDRLYKPTVAHSNDEAGASCADVCGNDPSRLQERREREEYEDNPAIFYGLIASADRVMKDALIRDRLTAEKDVLCFEMEAAGLMNHFPCLVIRGICDYADSHKNKEWQGYAAMAASAYARDLLYRIPANRLQNERRMGEILSELEKKVTVMSDFVRGREHDDILDWLSQTDYGPKHADVLRRWESGTGQWFLNSPEFLEWQKGDNKTLLCHGFPGAGKTTIAALVIECLRTTYPKPPTENGKQKDEKIGVAFMYCDSQMDNQPPQAVLATLVKQLVQQLASIPEIVKRFYEDNKSRASSSLSTSSFFVILQSVISSFARVFVVIDALDECQSRSEILDSMARVQSEVGVYLFATTRPEKNIHDEMKDLFRIHTLFEISASDHDVERYIDNHLSSLPLLRNKNQDLSSEATTNIIGKIKSKIIQAANGVFLLARFHLEELSDMYTPNEVVTALEELPIGKNALSETYGKTINRIRRQKGPRLVHLAERVLSLLTMAKRLLTMRELRDALAVKIGAPMLDPGDVITDDVMELIVSACAGLVTVNTAVGVVQLLHDTTREYLKTHMFCITPPQEPGHPEDPTAFNQDKNRSAVDRVHRGMALICVTYLSFDVFQSGPCKKDEFQQRLMSNPLYDYAACNWGFHAHALEASRSEETLGFLESQAKVEASSQALLAGESGNFPSQVTGLHLAAYFGLREALNCLLRRQHEVDPRDGKSRTPLSYAAELGHENVVERLLETGKVNPDLEDNSGYTPMSYASMAGFTGVVRRLFGTRKVNADSKNQVGRTPLSLAAENGHVEVAKYLLGTRTVDVDSKCGGFFSGRTPLSFAAASGYEAIVKLLLETGKVNADTASNGLFDAGQSPLSLAAENGHMSVVELLLKTGRVDVNSTSAFGSVVARPGRTALSFAAETGHNNVVNLLLDTYGVDTDGQDHYGRTPLSYATENGHETIAKLLLEKGKAAADSKSRTGVTPLSFAAMRGHTKIVKILLDTGVVDVNAVEEQQHYTPLSLAAENGYTAVVEMLFNTASVEVNSKCISRTTYGVAGPDEVRTPAWHDRTPLSLASNNGKLEVVKLLLGSSKADIDHRDSRGQTPLSLAAENGHATVVELLLDTCRTDVNSRSNPGRGPPPWAGEEGPQNLWVPTSIMETGLSGLLDDRCGRTPLSLAAGSGHGAVVERLILTKAVEVDSKDTDYGRTPLSWAASTGCVHVVEMLLGTTGVDADSKDFFGRTPLSWAAGDGHESVVKSMLHKGKAESDSVDYFGRSPLLWAAESGHDKVVRLLLTDRRVLRNRRANYDGRSPLSWASGNGHEAAVRALLDDSDVDVDCKDFDNRTPLSFATENGHEAVVRLLLATGKVDLLVEDDKFS